MRVTTNEDLVARGGRAGQLAAFIALIMVLASLVMSFTEYKVLAFILVVLGVVMYTVGNRSQEQAVREPRLIQQLAGALNEFDDRYHLYNHVLPADHVLLTPYGVFVLVARGMGGRIRCFRDKWARDLTWGRILRFFTEESLGNPSKEAQQEAEKLQKYLQEHTPHLEPEVQALVVFVDPTARLEISSASAPVLPLRRVKSHIRKAAGRTEMPGETLADLTRLFDEAPRG
jgi:hypothetical protein